MLQCCRRDSLRRSNFLMRVVIPGLSNVKQTARALPRDINGSFISGRRHVSSRPSLPRPYTTSAHFRFLESQDLPGQKELTDDRIGRELYKAVTQLLQQYSDLLETIRNDPHLRSSYCKTSKYVPPSTIGKHVRHVLEHFKILLVETKRRTIIPQHMPSDEQGNPDHVLQMNYDDRKPKKETAQDIDSAIAMLEDVRKDLLDLAKSSIRMADPVILAATVRTETFSEAPFVTSLGREIWFLCHHAIHHAALIRAICLEHQVPVDESFGVSPGTVKNIEMQKNKL
ncbi:hypothetical protein DFS34DRAFT_426441 [Phlyctochytrium arcticum]|nr:hypothetical protein DFS34DRAFT_426441 [Phlyctochytrium arcticum]